MAVVHNAMGAGYNRVYLDRIGSSISLHFASRQSGNLTQGYVSASHYRILREYVDARDSAKTKQLKKVF
jgi:hypothetical protein